jgi:hypothetical protein
MKKQIIAFPGSGKSYAVKQHPERYVDIDMIIEQALPHDELPWVTEDFKSWQSDPRVLDVLERVPEGAILLTHSPMAGFETLAKYIPVLEDVMERKKDIIADMPIFAKNYPKWHADSVQAGYTLLPRGGYLTDVL